MDFSRLSDSLVRRFSNSVTGKASECLNTAAAVGILPSNPNKSRKSRLVTSMASEGIDSSGLHEFCR